MTEFNLFWEAYPKRTGGRNKAQAEEKFLKIIRAVPPSDVIKGARLYAKECDRLKTTGTQYVSMATTWLNQRRWEDYTDIAETAEVKIGDRVGDYVWTGSRWKPIDTTNERRK